ncbi:MAG TPA: hypothetical protein VHM70_10935 [Polyangiaceae bacterium]|nr:hypothetical protein [Polyangiaceae bacterium]
MTEKLEIRRIVVEIGEQRIGLRAGAIETDQCAVGLVSDLSSARDVNLVGR